MKHSTFLTKALSPLIDFVAGDPIRWSNSTQRVTKRRVNMSMHNDNPLIKLLKKSVGLPTGHSACCGSSAASGPEDCCDDGECCDAGSTEDSAGGCGCAGA